MATIQHVNVESKDFSTLIRKIIKNDDWRCRADESTGWNVRFDRLVKGDIGEPDREVEVQTDLHITLCGKFGENVKSWDDAEPVHVFNPRYVCLGQSDTMALAQLLHKFPGLRLELHGSAGSASSSRHGLTFYFLSAKLPGVYAEVQIGGQVVANGKQLVSGCVGI